MTGEPAFSSDQYPGAGFQSWNSTLVVSASSVPIRRVLGNLDYIGARFAHFAAGVGGSGQTRLRWRTRVGATSANSGVSGGAAARRRPYQAARGPDVRPCSRTDNRIVQVVTSVS